MDTKRLDREGDPDLGEKPNYTPSRYTGPDPWWWKLFIVLFNGFFPMGLTIYFVTNDMPVLAILAVVWLTMYWFAVAHESC